MQHRQHIRKKVAERGDSLLSPLRMGIWNIDGRNRRLPFPRRLEFAQRLPAVGAFVQSVRFDVFAITGAPPAVVDAVNFVPHAPEGSVPPYRCVAAVQATSGLCATYVFVPAEPAESAWAAEVVPGACGAHVRFTHKRARRTSMSDVAPPAAKRVTICFLDLEASDVNTVGQFALPADAAARASTPPIVPLTQEMALRPGAAVDVGLAHDTNGMRVARYLSNVAKSVDVVAGHLRRYKFDPPGSVRPTWSDAWHQAGGQGLRATLDMELLRQKYLVAPPEVRGQQSGNGTSARSDAGGDAGGGAVATDDAPAAADEEADHQRRKEAKLLGRFAKQYDRILLRSTSKIRVADLRTVVGPYVATGDDEADQVLASAYLPVVAELRI